MIEPTSAESGTLPAAPPPPPRVAGYRILETIATGGMGIVYRAVQENLGRVVALKMISAGGLATGYAARRFHAEAEVVARLRHPSIVPVHEIGVAEGHPFFTMDLIEGRSLAALIAEGPIPPRRAAEIMVPVARAVAYAHGQGVIHRDLKPANILLDNQNAPWVTDFGLAKCVDREQDLTTHGALLGTPSYMAPEQASGNGEAVSFRTDVYALGAVLYAMLTGRPPHVGGTSMSTLQQVMVREPVPPRILNPGVDRDLETICLAALRKAPERRYAGAGAFGDDLERWLGARPIAARRPGIIERAGLWIRRRPAVAVLTAGVVAVAALGFGGVLWQWREAVAANETAGIARDRQLATQIEALRVADPGAVTYLIDTLLGWDVDLAPRLRAILAGGVATGRERLRVALALLALESGTLDLVETEAGSATPDELMMIRSEVLRRRKHVPDGVWPAFIDRWWDRAQDTADARSSLRATALLAGWAPSDGRWTEFSGSIARRLVAEPSILLGTWIDLLRPIADAVIPGLLEILRDRAASERDLGQAEDLLVELAAGRPEVLVRCLLKAREKAFRRFLDAATVASPGLVELLTRVLEEPPPALGMEAPVPASEVGLPAELAARLETAGGGLGGEWAWVPAVDPGSFSELVGELASEGYRLERLRPFVAQEGLRISAQWRRDGVEAEHRLALTRMEFAAEESRQRAEGRVPEDLAAWFDGDPPELRLAAVWIRPSAPEERRVLAGLPPAEHSASYPALGAGGFHPLTLTVAAGAGGVRAVASIWKRRRVEPDFLFDLESAADLLEAGPHPCRVLCDLVFPASDPPLAFSGLWVSDPELEDRIVAPCDVADHATRAGGLAASGFRPKAIACARGPTDLMAASVWVRRATSAVSAESQARRQARAVTALAILGDPAALPRVLGGGLGASVRIHACRLLAEFPVPLAVLWAVLDRSEAPAPRIGVLLALGCRGAAALPEPERREAGDRLAVLYRDDPHPGVHSAAEWALQRLEVAVPEADAPLAPSDQVRELTWSRDGEGHTLIHIHGPVEFLMGTRGSEEGRRFGEERHRRRISRTFAVASKEVSVAQFRRFLDDRPEFAPDFPEEILGRPEEPICAVTWLHASQYCRWLSEREGIEHDQICYPRSTSIGPEFRLPPEVLARRGYRLPTEAEWEYVARSGSAEMRWCGPDPSLLDTVAWWRRNAEAGPRPAGSLIPNSFGFFDVLGNAVEWCHGRMIEYPLEVRQIPLEDREDAEPFTPGDRRALRGGSFDDLPAMLRSGARRRYDSAARGHTVGFRVARTIE